MLDLSPIAIVSDYGASVFDARRVHHHGQKRVIAVDPHQIDHAVLAAINVTLYLSSGGDDRVSEGFNKDLAGNGRDFGRWVMEPAPV